MKAQMEPKTEAEMETEIRDQMKAQLEDGSLNGFR